MKEVWSANECHLCVYMNDKMGKLYLFHQHDRALYQTTDGLEMIFLDEEAKKPLLQEVLCRLKQYFCLIQNC